MERLHCNYSGKPGYVQRWHLDKDHAALLGYSGRLGEESLFDIIITIWHDETSDTEAWRIDLVLRNMRKQ